MDNFLISYIAFLDLVFFCNVGPMLIAVFITEMVILHKCFYYYYYCYYYIIIIITGNEAVNSSFRRALRVDFSFQVENYYIKVINRVCIDSGILEKIWKSVK